MNERNLFMVWSTNYGAWLFTTSDKAWKFMEEAVCLECKRNNTWHINVIKEADNIDLDKLYINIK